MKSAIMTVAAFAIAMLTATTISLQRAPWPEPPVDTLALADSLLADSLWRDSVTALDHGTDVPPSVSTAASFGTTPTTTVVSPNPSGVTTGDDVTEEERTEALQSLAQIFARMTPDAAAEILRYMSDSEVEAVVRNLGSRQAATVLSNLPEQRAAELARRLIDVKGGHD